MSGKFENGMVDIIMIVVMVLVIAVMAAIIPDMITEAGFTGAAATIVGLIPFAFPVSVILVFANKLYDVFKGGN